MTTRKPILIIKTQADALSLFEYEPLSGRVLWRETGAEAGSLSQGYIRIKRGRRSYLAHRMAWLCWYGHWPSLVDHINGDRRDNRICNLREATRSQNKANSRVSKHNQSGLKGVGFHPSSGLWRARIRVNKRLISLGLHKTAAEAHAAYAEAAKRYHGDFARTK